MTEYRCDFMAVGTAYIHAPTAEAAKAKLAKAIKDGMAIQFAEKYLEDDGFEVSPAFTPTEAIGDAEEAD